MLKTPRSLTRRCGVIFLALSSAVLCGCGGTVSFSSNGDDPPPGPGMPGPPPVPPPPSTPVPGTPFAAAEYARFAHPRALALLPGGRMLVGQTGRLALFDPRTGASITIQGVPDMAELYALAVHPRHAGNRLIYLSWASAGNGGGDAGTRVARARLERYADGSAALRDLRILWQRPSQSADGDDADVPLAPSPDGRHLFIGLSDRGSDGAAQDRHAHPGKLLRLNADDGSAPADNPFFGQGEIAAQVWTFGHRIPTGLAFDGAGRLWASELGPNGGDELNLLRAGGNHGWPMVAEAGHADGTPIPRHHTRPDLQAPAASWTPAITPSAITLYDGRLFPDWRGQALIASPGAQTLIRVRLDGSAGSAEEAARYWLGWPVGETVTGRDGAIWLLETGADARLLRLTPHRR